MSEKKVASAFFKGMMAHALCTRAFYVSKQTRVLVHDVDNAAAYILAQFIKHNAHQTLICSVSSEENKENIKSIDLCNDIINYNMENMSQIVKDITNNKGVNVVYDSIGSEYIMNRSIQSLSTFGLLALYDKGAHDIGEIRIKDIMMKSLFVTCVNMFHYKNLREEFVLTANEIFSRLGNGKLQTQINEIKMNKLESAIYNLEKSTSISSTIVSF